MMTAELIEEDREVLREASELLEELGQLRDDERWIYLAGYLAGLSVRAPRKGDD
jgi:hypothetical protein